MAKYLIDETTLINIADAIREKSGKIQKELILDETDETFVTWGGGLGAIWDIYNEVTLLHEGDTCIVTIDNVKYITNVYHPESGWMCLGNAALSSDNNSDADHINDMPFLVEYGPQDTGSGMEWYHELSVTYADSNMHTIKIEKLLTPIEPIQVKNFATEIRNIPAGKTTKTINIDWSSDFEQTAILNYYDENFVLQEACSSNVDVIEAQGGIILVNKGNIDYMTDNFIELQFYRNDNIYMATKDNETIGLYSSSVQ